LLDEFDLRNDAIENYNVQTRVFLVFVHLLKHLKEGKNVAGEAREIRDLIKSDKRPSKVSEFIERELFTIETALQSKQDNFYFDSHSIVDLRSKNIELARRLAEI